MAGNTSGKWGEAKALEFLQSAGYRLIEAGYWTRHGEIDLIVEDGRYLVFAEVKTRKNAEFAEAREFVGTRKQERLRRAALIWLSEHETQLQPRFDVIEVYAPQGIKTVLPEIIHLINAFE